MNLVVDLPKAWIEAFIPHAIINFVSAKLLQGMDKPFILAIVRYPQPLLLRHSCSNTPPTCVR